MFHQIIFLLLIVSSLSCNFNRCAVCFQSFMNIACRSTQNAARIKRFLRLHIIIKPLKINIINSSFCWSVTLLMFIQTLYHSSHWKFGAGRIGNFGNILNGFAKSPRLIVLNIDWVQFVLKNCEILHVSEVWMINTAPHSTLSPQIINCRNSRHFFKEIEQRARIGKIFSRWHLAIAITSS